MVPVKPAPSLHQIAAGFFTPNSYETINGIMNTFGATTLALVGFDECGQGSETEGSFQRALNYQEFLTYF